MKKFLSKKPAVAATCLALCLWLALALSATPAQAEGASAELVVRGTAAPGSHFLGLAWVVALGVSWFSSLRAPVDLAKDRFYRWRRQPGKPRPTSESADVVHPGESHHRSDSKARGSDRQPENVTSEEVRQLSDLIYRVMETDSPYLDPALTLAGLAETLGLCRHRVSRAINQGLGVNYYDLVNSFRVRAAERLLCSDQGLRLSVLDIAYEVGFNSSATFYRAFKKHTGTTPTAFASQPTDSPPEHVRGSLAFRPTVPPLPTASSPADPDDPRVLSACSRSSAPRPSPH